MSLPAPPFRRQPPAALLFLKPISPLPSSGGGRRFLAFYLGKRVKLSRSLSRGYYIDLLDHRLEHDGEKRLQALEVSRSSARVVAISR